MFTASKLSVGSQDFINFLSNGERPSLPVTSLAIAKVLANFAAMPSGEVEDPMLFFKTSSLIDIQSKLSILNELVMIDFNTVLEYTYKFFAIRYFALYPKKQLFCLRPESATEDLLGASHVLEGKVFEIVKENPLLLTKIHNGIVNFYDDVCQDGA